MPGPLPAMVSLYLGGGALLGVMSSTALAIEVQPYWNVFEPLHPPRKLWNEEQIGVQQEAPVIPQ